MNAKPARALLALMAASIVFGSACHRIRDQVIGSGVRKTEMRDVEPFTSISTEGAFEIEVVAQKDQSVQIEADDNVLPRLKTEVSHNVLHIRANSNFSVRNAIKVKITVPDLEAITATGAGTINISGLKNDKFKINVNGAPTLKVAGESSVAEIDVNGAATVDTHRLKASQVTVDSNGVSRVEVYARERLDVKISGPSQVIYEGEPEVNQTINGPGSLQKKEAKGA